MRGTKSPRSRPRRADDRRHRRPDLRERRRVRGGPPAGSGRGGRPDGHPHRRRLCRDHGGTYNAGRSRRRCSSMAPTGRWSGRGAGPKPIWPTRACRRGWNGPEDDDDGPGSRQALARRQRASPPCSGRTLAAKHAVPHPRSRPARREYRKDGEPLRRAEHRAPAARQDPQVDRDRQAPIEGGRDRHLLRQARRGRGARGRRNRLHPHHLAGGSAEGCRRLAALNRLCPDLMVVTDSAANAEDLAGAGAASGRRSRS